MVCIPCIVIPVFLYIWHRFLQPLVIKFWRLWGSKQDKQIKGNVNSDELEKKSSCPFSTTEKSPQPPKNPGTCDAETEKKTS
ncbi:hypothetical protein GHT06_017105 [Daphnia sinensis]|uniref:Uncharacterized protein n=1 Tax=Daphnia sinensis TaxID=1820382 RepID=A0AAD5PVS0_9CRUS|nr:hypothetical protein GHT06_017105 [Daphnia sinensis]